jgi:class 3 adenylate cyclase
MVSEEVREALLYDHHMQLGGELKVVTVLFTDIRQFTTFSENHSPEEVVGMLNSYFSIVNSAVREAGGMINKFGGDSTLAIFGAPVNLTPSETAYRALRAALSIRIRIIEANAYRIKAGLEALNIGIGINTGEVITGNVGAEDRFEYTVIGDTVNVAFRMQNLSNQFPDSNIFITENTYQALNEPERLLVADHGEVAMKGRTELVHVYSLMGMKWNEMTKVQPNDPTWRNKIIHRDALETAYLYCRGFDPQTIAAAKNLPVKTIVSWIEEAALQYEHYKQELCLEFRLSDMELHYLFNASRGGLPDIYSFEWETQRL